MSDTNALAGDNNGTDDHTQFSSSNNEEVAENRTPKQADAELQKAPQGYESSGALQHASAHAANAELSPQLYEGEATASTPSNSFKNNANEISAVKLEKAVQETLSTTSETAEIYPTHAIFKGLHYCGEYETIDPRSETLILQQIFACSQRFAADAETPTGSLTTLINFVAPRRLNSSAMAVNSTNEKILFNCSVMTIIFCSRGASLNEINEEDVDIDDESEDGDQAEKHSASSKQVAGDINIQSFFAFTCCTSLPTEVINEPRRFVCHVVRANSSAQVDQILSCFQEAFRRDTSLLPTKRPAVEGLNDKIVTFCFEASIEIQERDTQRTASGASNAANSVNGSSAAYVNCPVEGGRFFKFRRNATKKVLIQLTQLTPESPRLLVEKCFGILIAIGGSNANVTSQDFHLLDEVHLFKSGKQVLMNAEWDVPGKKEFDIFCTEGVQNKQQNNRVPFKVAVDFVAVGMQAPLRFIIDTGARVLAPNERSWGAYAFGSMLGKKHVQEVFYVRAQYIPPAAASSGGGHYDVLSISSQSAITRAERQQANKLQNVLPGTKSHAGDQSSDASSVITTTSGGADDLTSNAGGGGGGGGGGADTDDEPLMSGCGNIHREILNEAEQRQWDDAIKQLQRDESMPTKNPRKQQYAVLEKLIREFGGVPQAQRREIWQRLANSYNARELFDIYKSLSAMNCGCEAEILKDTSRTFPANEFFRQSGGEGQEALFRLCKSYALYDSETGYHQSISFIAASLLLQMPEEQAFCLLVKIMHDYKQRNLVNNEFYGLRLKYFQLERFIEEKMPHLHAHMRRVALEVHMFASQWFLTMFTAKFPLPLVYRIFDIFLLEGEHIMLITAFALLKLCQNDLMLKNFEESLKYFRVSLPKLFLNEKRCNKLVQLIFELRPLADKQLKRYESEFEKKCADEAVAQDPLAALRREFRRVMQQSARAETENDELANELINTRLALRSQVDRLEDDNERLQYEISRMRSQLNDSEQQEQNLHHEVTKIKQLYRELEHDNSSKQASLHGYKQVSSQLSLRLEEEQNKRTTMMQLACELCREKIQQHFAGDGQPHDRALQQHKNSNDTRSNSVVDGSRDETAQEQHSRELEEELARTKLALVDCHCKYQELEHQLALAMAEIAATANKANSGGWLSKFNSIKQSIATPTTTTAAVPAVPAVEAFAPPLKTVATTTLQQQHQRLPSLPNAAPLSKIPLHKELSGPIAQAFAAVTTTLNSTGSKAAAVEIDTVRRDDLQAKHKSDTSLT